MGITHVAHALERSPMIGLPCGYCRQDDCEHCPTFTFTMSSSSPTFTVTCQSCGWKIADDHSETFSAADTHICGSATMAVVASASAWGAAAAVIEAMRR